MSIDISAEQVFPISEAPQHIPGRPSVATVWRWILTGTRAGKLDSVLIGGRRFTSIEAVQRFADRGTAVGTGQPAPARTPRARAKAIAKAERDLVEAGI